MKVRVTATLDVDDSAWNEAYGPNGTVREDILSYALSLLREMPFVREVKR